MKVVGILLIVLGILGFVLGSVSFTQDREVADLGPVEIEQEETTTIPITPIASGVAVAAGVALVFIGTRRRDA